MSRINTYKLTVLALLAAVAIAGRNIFVFLPNVQPVTAIIITAGIQFGAMASVLLSLVIVLVSNTLLGMGVWSIWQIVCWGIIGIMSAFLQKPLKKFGLYAIVPYAIFTGYLYGLLISIPTYQVTGNFWPYYLAGLPFDTYHALGNGAFMLVLYPILASLMKKYGDRHF